MEGFSKVCTHAPPTIIKPREINSLAIPIGKAVWILHPDGNGVLVDARKSGISWKAKSSKLGA